MDNYLHNQKNRPTFAPSLRKQKKDGEIAQLVRAHDS